jgi:hypothetical protein
MLRLHESVENKRSHTGRKRNDQLQESETAHVGFDSLRNAC